MYLWRDGILTIWNKQKCNPTFSCHLTSLVALLLIPPSYPPINARGLEGLFQFKVLVIFLSPTNPLQKSKMLAVLYLIIAHNNAKLHPDQHCIDTQADLGLVYAWWVIFNRKPTANWSPYIFTLVQKVKHRVYKIHVFSSVAILCRDSASYFI